MSMAKQGAKTAVPKLRFPEFRGAPRWSTKVLGDEGEFLSTLTGKSANDFGTGNAKYVTYMNVFSNTFTDMGTLGIVDVGSDESQNAIQRGDVLFTVSSETPEEVGMSSVVIEAAPNCYVNSFCAMFRFSEGHQPNLHFLGYSLRQPFARRHFVQRAQGSTRFNLSKPAFRSLPLAIPFPSEQQKIADCLTSLDEVIAAQGRKVEALKAHKRGLMQQLFPREGETRPRLRFPEFRDAPEWGVRSLSQIIQIASGQIDPKETPYCNLPHVGGENIECETGYLTGLKSARENGVISGKFLFDERDILYSKIRPMLNKVATPDFKGICSADIYPVRPSTSDVTRHFLVWLLRSEPFIKYAVKHSERGKIPKINREALTAYVAPLPQPAEQQRIADCLSSLDTQINAETHHLAALKTHKQGLMQQLFPAPGAAGA